MIHPIVLIIWALFALVVMSPVGYWAVRGVRRLRARKRLAALAPPALSLPQGATHEPTLALAERALSCRAALREPLRELEDYLAALPLLDVELHLSRAMRFRSSWGIRMRDRYTGAVSRAFLDARAFVDSMEAMPETVRDELIRAGAGPHHLTRVLVRWSADESENFGDAEAVAGTRQLIEELASAYEGLARAVLERHGTPYR